MESVVIGAVDGYEWKQIQTWWRSIKLTGYSGQIHLLVYECSDETLAELRDHGVCVHRCEKEHGQVVVDRFKDLSRISNSIPTDVWCICTDVNDLVFQVDPSEYLNMIGYENYEIIVASEGILHKGNQWVRQNAIASLPDYWQTMSNKQLYNAGSFAIKAQILEELGKNVFALCMTNPGAKNHDQFALNILLQNNPVFMNWTWFERVSGTWCFNGASSIFAKPADAENYMDTLPIIKNGLCYNPNGELYYMFHHWNRNARIMNEVVNRINNEWQSGLVKK